MGYFIGWLVLAVLVGALGSSRKIGFGLAFLWALLLSPVIGLIIALISPSLKEEEYKEEVLKQNQKQTDALDKIKDTSIVYKLKDAKSLLDSGVLTQDEFAIVKSKIMASIEETDRIDSEYNGKEESMTTNEIEKSVNNDTTSPTNELDETDSSGSGFLKIIAWAAVLIILSVVIIYFSKSQDKTYHTETSASKYTLEASNYTLERTMSTFKRLTERKDYDSLSFYTAEWSSIDYKKLLDSLSKPLELIYLDEDSNYPRLNNTDGSVLVHYMLKSGGEKVYEKEVKFKPLDSDIHNWYETIYIYDKD